jgi:hypothetical protein
MSPSLCASVARRMADKDSLIKQSFSPIQSDYDDNDHNDQKNMIIQFLDADALLQ